MIRILITGANGQLGLCLRKISCGYKDVQIFSTDLPELDITHQKKTAAFINKIQPAFIVNCAAYTAVDKAETEKEAAFQVNAEAVRILGEIIDKSGSKLIHVSSDYVFNGKNYKPYNEDDAPDPVSIYGASKLKGEKYLAENSNAIICRTSWLYSEYGNNFVKNILAKASKREELRVVYDQIGSPTYAGDLAETILEIITRSERNEISFIPGIYHYTNEGVASWYDFSKEILQLSGYELHVTPVESKDFKTIAKRPHYSVLAKNKIRNLINHSIPYWRDSLKTCLQEINKNNQ